MRYKLIVMTHKELNRLKLLLVEKRKQAYGWLSNLEKIKQPSQNGALIQVSQTLSV